jgi:hypothetical protein
MRAIEHPVERSAAAVVEHQPVQLAGHGRLHRVTFHRLHLVELGVVEHRVPFERAAFAGMRGRTQRKRDRQRACHSCEWFHSSAPLVVMIGCRRRSLR